ncbi:MAG: hypothetical protein KC501_40615 [Myxococcales bacterium]|nr:hypothetical protein [Myxococcales bacterium]
MRTALQQAKNQFNELELDAALATLDAAIARAQGAGMAADPALAPLHVLRGGIIFSIDGDRSRTVAAFQEAVRADYYSALPIELRSEELQALLDEARASVPKPNTGPMAHTPPAAAAGQDITLDALSSVPLDEGVTMVVYWRKKGTEDSFNAVYMDLFGNLGTVTIPAAEHGDAGIEYFFYVYNGQQQQLANLGDKEKPLVLELGAGGGGGEGGGEGGGGEGGGGEGGGGGGGGKGGTHPWPRGFINLGVGTGFGVAHGSAELTYQQFTPGTFGALYGPAEQACAIERWFSGTQAVASNPAEFAQHIAMLDPSFLPNGDADPLIAAYNPDQCGQHHPVTTGFASAPFHIAPEVGVRVLDRDLGETRALALVVSGFARLQVVTGSKVFTENPTLATQTSYIQEVRSPNPPGFQRKPPFTWAAGLKLKALVGKRGGKFQGVVGAFGGYGNARLRVNMGFSNDRNGNSVPDRAETALSGPADANNQVPIDQCTPVWPYNNGCMNSTEGMADQNLALQVQASSPANELRIDTVRIGPGFAGVLFGFHYQLHKYFAVYGEANVGGWFPDVGSLLIDVNVGPVITF